MEATLKKIVTLLLMLCLLPMSVFAQTPASPTLAEMKKLDFLVGQWQGEGYFLLGPSQRKTFSQTENIQRKVEGTILHMEGLGKAKTPATREPQATTSSVSCLMIKIRKFSAGECIVLAAA